MRHHCTPPDAPGLPPRRRREYSRAGQSALSIPPRVGPGVYQLGGRLRAAPTGTVTQRARGSPENRSPRRTPTASMGPSSSPAFSKGSRSAQHCSFCRGNGPLVGWESEEMAGDWQFIETTMIGSHEFDAACASGQKQYEQAKNFYPEDCPAPSRGRSPCPRHLADGMTLPLRSWRQPCPKTISTSTA